MKGPPRSLLFACTRNAVRSPMAEMLAKRWLGSGTIVDSAGVEPSLVNPFAIAVMDEVGLDIRGHRTRTFEELSDCSFDLVVALSESAYLEAESCAARLAATVEYWQVPDPTLNEGSREQRLAAFRSVRGALDTRIRQRFPKTPGLG